MSATDKTPNARPNVMIRISNDPWWLELSRRQKNEWIARPDKKFDGTLPPLILPERDGQLLAYIIAPVPSKDCCFTAADACRRGLACDGLTVVMDARMPLGDYASKIMRSYADGTYQHGDVQRLHETENACERSLLTECLVIYRCSRGAEGSGYILTYSSHGTGGKFEWTPQHDKVVPPGGSGGRIPDVLQRILAEPSMMVPHLPDSVFHDLGITVPREMPPDDRMHLLAKEALHWLREDGFTVYDFLDDPIELEQF